VSFIRTIPPDAADGATAAAYAHIVERTGRTQIQALWRTLGLDPEAIPPLFEWRRALLDHPDPLTAAQAFGIAVVVSATNGCGYSVTHQGKALAQAVGDEPLARAIALDYREADLPARDRVLLDYAVALTCEPAERTAADVERLREYGFDDAGILKATEITALVNASNRLLNGLGVALEDGVEAWAYGAPK
jgi:uncharacterized peroxidase-related enzyme